MCCSGAGKRNPNKKAGFTADPFLMKKLLCYFTL